MARASQSAVDTAANSPILAAPGLAGIRGMQMPDAAVRTGADTSGPILSESRRVRYFSFFLFYVSQGLPYGLTTKAR